jgi:hypothetical protein
MKHTSTARLEDLMRASGGIASRNRLIGLGLTTSVIDHGRAEGVIRSIRRGLYASSGADIDQLRAVRLGGRLSCLSALRRHRVWAGIDTRLHVCVDRRAHHLRTEEVTPLGRSAATGRSDSNFHADAGVPRVHWQRESVPELHAEAPDGDWIMPPLVSLRQAILCQSEEHAIASIDSALRTGFITSRHLGPIFARLPQRLQHLRLEIDRAADSGNESVVRVLLRRAGFHVETQVSVNGTSRFDLLVDGVVSLDVDSRQWHSDEAQLHWDYDKVLQSFAGGVPSLRILPRHIST